MSEFIWLDDYNIGFETIDRHHQQLFNLANHLVTAEDTKALTEQAMALYRYIRQHFETEEDLMKQFHYPAYTQHVEAHNQMLDKLVEISNRIHDETWQRGDVLSFMREWVLEHILDLDMRLGEFLQQQTEPSLAS